MSAGTASTIRALTCPSCGGTIALRAAGNSVNLVCEFCGSTLDTTDPEVRIIAEAHEAMRQPEIALGTRGTLEDVQWEIVGYLERDDGETGWAEYLLFNPYRGYAFLVDDGRRFSLGRLLDRLPEYGYGSLSHGGFSYQQHGTSYGTWVRFVVGEFYWRVAVGEEVSVTDYVRPGVMLSCEENEGERSWTLLKMLDRGVAEAAFGIEKRPRDISTPAPHEPSPYRERMVEALIIGIIAGITLLLIAAMGSGAQRVAAAASFDTAIDGPKTSHVLSGIKLTNTAGSAVTIAAYAPGIENGWVDVDVSLVNVATDQNFDGYVLLENYNGVDGDGPWREGNRRSSTTFSSVPAGTYELIVELTAYRWVGSVPFWQTASTQAAQLVDIDVTAGGIFAGNVLLALFVILLWPGILLLLHAQFEHRRMAPVRE